MTSVFMNIFEGQQLKATLFLIALGVLLLVALVFVALSFRAQKTYNTEALPTLPGMDDDEDLLVVEEKNTSSAFHIDEDDELHSMGDKEAVDLLKEMRAASGATVVSEKKKKKRSGLFGKKS